MQNMPHEKRTFTRRLQFDMMTSWHGNTSCITGFLWGESIGHRWIPLTKGQQCRVLMFRWSRRAKKSNCWWFETPWRYCDVTMIYYLHIHKHSCLPCYVNHISATSSFWMEPSDLHRVIQKHWWPGTFWRGHVYFAISTVPADDLAS